MPITIPEAPYNPPLFRALIKDSFAAVTSANGFCVSSGVWAILSAPTPTSYGYELLDVKRKALPEIGTARFRYCAGSFPGVVRVDPPDLHKKEIRLQLSNDGGTTWRTVFWGHVDVQEDMLYPGSSAKSGIRVYRVVDGFARATKWIMDHIGYDGAGGSIYGSTTTLATGGAGPGAYGHPGYNYQLQSDGPVLGNKSPSNSYIRNGTTVKCHIWQGAYAATSTDPAVQTTNKWNEQEMIENACAGARPDGDPEFRLRGDASDNFKTYSPQGVYPNSSVWDFVARLVDRKRGYGSVHVDWIDTGDQLDVFLSVGSIIGETISYNIPGQSGATDSVTGAASAGTAYMFDGDYKLILEGDHRNVDEMFRYSDAETNVHDLVETVGEQIEVACTLCGYDAVEDDMTAFYTVNTISISPRWSTADVDAFVAQTTDHRTQPYWDNVYQSFGLPRMFQCKVGDGNGGGLRRMDYRCLDSGEIFAPDLSVDPFDTPVNTIEILGSIPFYEGYRYDGTYPKKTDGASEYGMPSRRAPMVLLRPSGWEDPTSPVAGADRWILPFGQYPQDLLDAKINPSSLGEIFSPSVTIHPDAIICLSQKQMGYGLRIIGDPVKDATLAADNKLASAFPVTRLAFTVALRLPWRVRMATWSSSVAPGDRTMLKVRRRRVVYVENCNLWLADSGCIYDLNGASTATNGFLPLRGALGSAIGAPAILRDDRPLLARFHTLSSAWYLSPRRRLAFGMKYCGFFDFSCYVGEDLKTGRHPKMGEYIVTCRASGTDIPVGTVVTSIEYDHQTGITIWNTDWFNLELKL